MFIDKCNVNFKDKALSLLMNYEDKVFSSLMFIQ